MLFYCIISLLIASKLTQALSRPHMGVWFNHTVRHYGNYGDYYEDLSQSDYALMMRLVSQNFTTLLLGNAPSLPSWPSKEETPQFVWIPSIVADLNRERLPQDKAINVIVTFSRRNKYTPNALSSFEVALRMANEANAVFPETVTTLVFIPEKLVFDPKRFLEWRFGLPEDVIRLSSEDTGFLQDVRKSLKMMENGDQYKLGMMLHVERCIHDYATVDVDVVVALITDQGPTFHVNTTDRFEKCEEALQFGNRAPELVPLFVATVAEPPGSWELYSQWAADKGRTAIMFEAFDDYRLGGGRKKWVKQVAKGWWDVEPNWKSGQRLNESVFVDKSVGEVDWQQKCETVDYAGGLLGLRFLSNKTNPAVRFLFNRRTGVMILPERSEEIRLTSKKLNAYYRPNYLPNEYIPTADLIPELVAEFNNATSVSTKLEVFVSCDELVYDPETRCRQTLALANHANAIHPETISVIFVHPKLLTDNNFINQMNTFSIGIAFNASYCSDQQYLQLIPRVDVVAIGIYNFERLKQGESFHRGISNMLSKAQTCANKLKAVKHNIRIIPILWFRTEEDKLRTETLMWFSEWAKVNEQGVILEASNFPVNIIDQLGQQWEVSIKLDSIIEIYRYDNTAAEAELISNWSCAVPMDSLPSVSLSRKNSAHDETPAIAVITVALIIVILCLIFGVAVYAAIKKFGRAEPYKALK